MPDGRYMSGCGNYDDMLEIAAWLKAGRKQDDKPEIDHDTTSILIAGAGGCVWLSSPFLREVRVNDPYYAIGSGAEYALGAMAAGASARQAIVIATRFCRMTGNGVDVVRFRKVKT